MHHLQVFALASVLIALSAELRAEEFLVIFERLERRGSRENVESAEPIVLARHEFVMAHGGSIELKDAKGSKDGMRTTISATLTASEQKEHHLKFAYRFANSEKSRAFSSQLDLNSGDSITLGRLLTTCSGDMCVDESIRVQIKRSILY